MLIQFFGLFLITNYAISQGLSGDLTLLTKRTDGGVTAICVNNQTSRLGLESIQDFDDIEEFRLISNNNEYLNAHLELDLKHHFELNISSRDGGKIYYKIEYIARNRYGRYLLIRNCIKSCSAAEKIDIDDSIVDSLRIDITPKNKKLYIFNKSYGFRSKDSSVTPDKISIKSRRKKIYLNKATYLHYIDKIEEEIKLNEFKNLSNEKLCLSFILSMCIKCSITLIFKNHNGYREEFPYNEQKLIYMESVILEPSSKELEFKAIAYFNGQFIENRPHWSINLQYCDTNKYNVLSYTTKNNSNNTKFECLDFVPGKVVGETKDLSDDEICPIRRNFGEHCNITCQDVTNEAFCDGYKICRDGNKCTCAVGYEGDNCGKVCRDGSYGYNCKKNCSQYCKDNRCEKNSGRCTKCTDEYSPPFCTEPLYPRLSTTPTVSDIGVDFIQLKLNNTKYEGTKPPKFVKIQYKTVSDSNWSTTPLFYPLKLDQVITITGLKKSTNYTIRAILYTENNDYQPTNLNVSDITVSTVCKDVDKLSYETTSTKITIIYPEDNDQICLSSEYRLVVNGLQRHFDTIGKGYKDDLKPFSKHEISLCKDGNCFIRDVVQTKEAAPGKVQNLVAIPGIYSIKISWKKPLEINGILKDYAINYKFIQTKGCEDQQINTYTTTKYTKNLTYSLNDLASYAKYEISVYARNSINGIKDTIYVYTKPTEKPGFNELISSNSIHIEEHSKYVVINWVPLECNRRQGPLKYLFVALCDIEQHDWCGTQQFLRVNAYDVTAQIENLIPYTNYNLFIAGIRNDFSTEMKLVGKFKTKSDVPPEITQMRVFTKDDTYLVLQWKPPHPPYGQIERYRIHLNTGDERIIREHQIKQCEIHNEYICYNFTGLIKDSTYYIQIFAKNKGAEENSINNNIYDGISERTKQEAPLKPENLTHIWSNNSLILRWNHPRIEKGPIKKFLIVLKIHKTKLLGKASKTFMEYYEIDRARQEYTYKVTSKFLLSTTYNLTVCAVNNYYGENSTDYIEALKLEPPKFSSEHFTYIVETENLLRVNLPEIDLLTITDETYIFIFVNRLEESDGNPQVKESTDKKFCDNVRKNNLDTYHNKNNWIAIEEKLGSSMKLVILGTGKVVRSKLLPSKSFMNKKLNLDEKSYGIEAVLVTKYDDDLICSSYKLPTYVPDRSTNLYYLFLLLIVPIIIGVGFLVYKKKMKNVQEINSDNPLLSQEMNNIRPNNSAENENLNVMSEKSNLLTSEEKSNIRPEKSKPDVPGKPPITNPRTLVKLNNLDVREKPNVPENPKKPTSEKPNVIEKPNIPIKPKIASQTESSGKIYHSKLINISDLEDYFRNAVENKELDEQHKLFIRGQTKPWDYGIKSENKYKNRYANLAAYDHNRVVLKRINGDSHSDYINASYINGYKRKNAYIATQGPKLTTINDFWRMIWQENVYNIIMLANLIEGGKKKCEKYWPELEETKLFGNIKVTYLKNDIYADFEYRTFQIQNESSNRTIEQYHFTSWPDHGVPVYPQSLIPFLKKINNISYKNGPIVVHCSAGIGRTGTIILTDICLRMAIAEEKIDALRYLQELREQRINMVDNVDQYTLVYTLLMEYLLAPETSLSCINFKQTLERIKADGTILRHFNYLKQTLWQDEKYKHKENYNSENDSKNRIKTIIPKAERVSITFDDNDPNSNYINAVPVDGFRLKNHFIATQIPMPNTIQDFWSMIKEQNITVIVALNDIPITDQTCCKYYPSIEEELTTSRGVTIVHIKTEMFNYYDIIYLEMKYKNIQSEESSQIQLIQVKGWNYNKKVPNKSEMLFTLFEDLEILSRAKHPICITCYDGTTACGLFIALSFVIEKIKLEQQVDVCLAVRIIRRNRLEFIRNEKQFKFLYDAADEFLDKFEDYWNFK